MQRLDPSEAQDVVRLAGERHSTLPLDGTTVEGLAEALNLPAGEVERLLAEVRGRRTPQAPVRQFGDRSAALSAAIVLALVIVVALVGGGYWLTHRPAPTSAAETMTIDDGEGNKVLVGPHGITVQSRGENATPAAPPSPSAPAAPDPTPGAATQQATDALKEAEAHLKDVPDADRAEAQAAIDAAKAELEKTRGR